MDPTYRATGVVSIYNVIVGPDEGIVFASNLIQPALKKGRGAGLQKFLMYGASYIHFYGAIKGKPLTLLPARASRLFQRDGGESAASGDSEQSGLHLNT